ncbi:uncharacterized protein GIQ15_02559 [Arthroderma uncinatum]|uniref:uncharacterized protein n=1 Tax=Arthroderma uncinatum TaxID=74035 RepID=UPI00144AC720|nr:uncharacterized protein GIQ15_02559 [Arthroderma uncinatum]KAF3483235.1 hypothetical protein GIQ15_02559 [Arthroderma uncinatum]
MSTAETGGAEPNGSEPIHATAGEIETGENAPGSEAAETGLSVDDILLPRSVIMRLAKDMLPPGTGVQRDAVTAILKAATVFVSYISSHANDMTDKKTLTPQDVLAALTEVELGDFRPHLEKQLKAYTAIMENKRESKKKGKSGKEGNGGIDDAPGSKRLKRDNYDQEKDVSGATTGNETQEPSSKGQRESLQGADRGELGEDDDDDTEAMEDANLSNEEEDEEEEPAEDDAESHGEQDDMDKIEDSDTGHRRRAAAAADSGSGSDSD